MYVEYRNEAGMIKFLYYLIMSYQAVNDYQKQQVRVMYNYILIALALIYMVMYGFSILNIVLYLILLIVLYICKGIASGDVKILLSYGMVNSLSGIEFLIMHLLLTLVILIVINFKQIMKKNTTVAMIPGILMAALMLELF